MPPQGSVPLPLRGVAVSRPGRGSWLADELLDTLIPWDPEARVVETRFPGVIAVYTTLDPGQLARIISRGYHSFMKRLTPAMAMVEARGWSDIEALIRGLLTGPPGRVRLILATRGVGKSLAGRGRLEDLVRSLGFTPSRGARMALAIESLDGLFLGAYGITSPCGPDCVTVTLP